MLKIVLQLKLYLPRLKETMNETVILFKTVPFDIQHIYSRQFFIDLSIIKKSLMQWYEASQMFIFFNIVDILKTYSWYVFPV